MTLIRIGVAIGVAVFVSLAGCGRKPVQSRPPTGGAGAGVVAGVGGAVGSGGDFGSGVGGGGEAGAGGAGTAAGGIGGAGGAASAVGVGGSSAGGAGGIGATAGSGGGQGEGGAGAAAGTSGTGGVPASCAEPCALPLVCERYPPPACADPQWVAWPMPNTAVDVAAGAPNEMSFTDNGDGTVTDNVTRLMWQQATPPDTFEFTQAGAFCQGLTLGGHDDWRLPSMIELVSIADLGRSNPAIDTTVFPGTPSDPFWSSTVWGTSASAEAIAFDRGNTRQLSMEMRLRVRCVR